MTLAEYIETMGLTQAAFAQKVPCSEAYISMIIKGKRPGWKMACRIENVTGGLVPLSNWYRNTNDFVIGEPDEQ
jgi:plasmid maintenance system antidote protein VapI